MTAFLLGNQSLPLDIIRKGGLKNPVEHICTELTTGASDIYLIPGWQADQICREFQFIWHITVYNELLKQLMVRFRHSTPLPHKAAGILWLEELTLIKCIGINIQGFLFIQKAALL